MLDGTECGLEPPDQHNFALGQELEFVMKASERDVSYPDSFYEAHRDGMTRSAKVVLSVLYEIFKPESVIDIGCGRGAWLREAGSLGSKILQGVEGAWIGKEDLLSPEIDLQTEDLENPSIAVSMRYDLCLSLEVAEHLRPSSAETFVELLCRASDVVLFSAAIPFQGGTNHLNERWQSYWAELFRTTGYECYDVIRPKIWTNNAVEWWYRQNILLFAREGSPVSFRFHAEDRAGAFYDLVHPANFVKNIQYINSTEAELRAQIAQLEFKLRNFD